MTDSMTCPFENPVLQGDEGVSDPKLGIVAALNIRGTGTSFQQARYQTFQPIDGSLFGFFPSLLWATESAECLHTMIHAPHTRGQPCADGSGSSQLSGENDQGRASAIASKLVFG